MVAAQQTPARSDIPKAATWNAESVFESVEAWQAEFDAVSQEIPKLADLPGTMTDAASFVHVMETLSQLRRRAMKLNFYALMSSAVDASNMEAKRLIGQIMGFMGQYGQRVAFVEPELIALGRETLEAWMQADERAALYRHKIEDLFRAQQHVQSAEVEAVLGMVAEPFAGTQQTANELTNTDLTFDDAVDSQGNPADVDQSSLMMRLTSADREERRTAWANYRDSYLAVKNTLASNYTTSVKQTVFKVRVRGYASSLQMQLFAHNIPVDVFHNLISTYRKNLPTWHRYWDVRRRALGQDSLHPYDIWAPIASAQPEATFEQSVDWISAALQPLGEDYVTTMRRGCLEERWVDWMPNKGKRQGAFSGGTYDTYPFIMMSHDDGLKGMSTLAHELGHSMHSYYARKTQPEIYAGYSMFAAEVASNFNQAMTRAYLFERETDPQFQLALIEEAMTNFHRYFFIMPTLARFEYEIHTRAEKGQPLTADDLNSIMRDLFAEGYGDTMSFDDDRTGITWATFGHLYVPFYTFQYATGISAAHALAERVRTQGPDAAADYLGFLSSGGALYPIDALKLAGVDMSTPEAVEKTYTVLADYVDRLEQLIR